MHNPHKPPTTNTGSFNPLTDLSPSPMSNRTRTGSYNLTATVGSTTLPTTWYFPQEFCTPSNRAFRVGTTWRTNVDSRITPDMTWTQAIDLQIANAAAGNVTGACRDVLADTAYTQFTCNVPFANGTVPLEGVTPGIVASYQPCQREYLIFLNGTAADPNVGNASWFSPNARVNYRVPGTVRGNAFFGTQGARVGGPSNTQNWYVCVLVYLRALFVLRCTQVPLCLSSPSHALQLFSLPSPQDPARRLFASPGPPGQRPPLCQSQRQHHPIRVHLGVQRQQRVVCHRTCVCTSRGMPVVCRPVLRRHCRHCDCLHIGRWFDFRGYLYHLWALPVNTCLLVYLFAAESVFFHHRARWIM